MADRPIIFSGPMVRALIEGRKTQTRRVLKVKPARQSLNPRLEDPRYAPGDRLYVREAFYLCDECGYLNHAEGANSAGTGTRKCCVSCDEMLPKATKPSIHMPRWASRLTLIVTEVRVQRLQDISEADAVAEGVSKPASVSVVEDAVALCKRFGRGFGGAYFADLWNSLHGPDAWDANPWVVALTFTVARGNIDQIGGTP